MPERSANLDLPYIQPSQAQKHVTHNEALQQLDALVQLSVIDLAATTPPGSPAAGDRYGLGSGASGAWSGHDGQIALWADSGWLFLAPQEGWRVWDQATASLMVRSGGDWTAPGFDRLGINASPDAINRLAVASDATLFSHDGDDHRLKLNKATATDTGTLLYQTGWTGHAEMGLSGSNDWSIKVSPDGSSWTEALKIDRTSGHATGAAVQSAAADTTPGRLMRADYGYGPGNLLGTVAQVSGTPTGAVVERGANANGEYVRFADGTQICWTDDFATTANAGNQWYWPVAFSNSFPVTVIPHQAPSGARYNIWLSFIGNDRAVIRSSDSSNDESVTPDCSILAIGRWF